MGMKLGITLLGKNSIIKSSKIECWGGTWPKKKEATGGWKKLPNKELNGLYCHQILGWSSSGQWGGWSIWHIWGKRAIHTWCRRGNVKEWHHWGSISFSASWDLLCLVLVIYIAVVDLPRVVELFILVSFMLPNKSRYSWVSIITSCGLDDWGSFPSWAREFFVFCPLHCPDWF